MDLKERVLEGELMDAPDLEAGLHHQALQGLQRVNWLSGTARIISRAILQAMKSAPKSAPWRILDLACGGGDVTLEVSQQLRRAGVAVHIEGWDRSGTAIAYARERARRMATANSDTASSDTASGQVQFHEHDAFDLNVDRQFDVVMCTLFLHHLDRQSATDLLSRMYRASRQLVLVDDLRRTW
ncbi:MAG: methyltransferase domain-containing protein, partial [Pirellulaceae bacterium]|nr:methyltransferase domain-containing protein [Pirellulaceae bacterium]